MKAKNQTKNIGIDVKPPKEKCEDKKCPFHGNIKPRGRIFTGVILTKDTHRTATIEWTYPILVPKYERSETRRTKIHVHNPACIDADIGDIVKVSETKPLSKTKNFVIIENMGKKKGFIEEMAAREEATVEGETKSEKELKKSEEKTEMEEKKEETAKEEPKPQKEDLKELTPSKEEKEKVEEEEAKE